MKALVTLTNSQYYTKLSSNASSWWQAKSAEEKGDIESIVVMTASALGTIIPMMLISLL